MKKYCILFLLLFTLTSAYGQENNKVGHRRAQHVVWIGIDGWGSYAFRDSFHCEMKNIRQLMAEGAWTTKARTVMPSVSTSLGAANFGRSISSFTISTCLS